MCHAQLSLCSVSVKGGEIKILKFWVNLNQDIISEFYNFTLTKRRILQTPPFTPSLQFCSASLNKLSKNWAWLEAANLVGLRSLLSSNSGGVFLSQSLFSSRFSTKHLTSTPHASYFIHSPRPGHSLLKSAPFITFPLSSNLIVLWRSFRSDPPASQHLINFKFLYVPRHPPSINWSAISPFLPPYEVVSTALAISLQRVSSTFHSADRRRCPEVECDLADCQPGGRRRRPAGFLVFRHVAGWNGRTIYWSSVIRTTPAFRFVKHSKRRGPAAWAGRRSVPSKLIPLAVSRVHFIAAASVSASSIKQNKQGSHQPLRLTCRLPSATEIHATFLQGKAWI